MNEETLHQIEQIMEYHFSDRTLLVKAFTHSSLVESRSQSNERLEFFGDSILSVVICQAVFERFPNYLEGDMTKIKSMLVSRRTCAKICRQLGLQDFLKVGKGMASMKALTGSLAAGLLEAVIGAIYLDGGLEAANGFILRIFAPLLDKTDAEQSHGNFKSLLQQHAQQHMNTTPIYELLDEKGPDHNKCFETEAIIADKHFPSAWGPNKKDAEQKAAYNALIELGVLKDKHSDQA